MQTISRLFLGNRSLFDEGTYFCRVLFRLITCIYLPYCISICRWIKEILIQTFNEYLIASYSLYKHKSTYFNWNYRSCSMLLNLINLQRIKMPWQRTKKIERVDQNGRMPASYGRLKIHKNIDTCTFVEGSISQENNASRNFCKIISLNLDNFMIFWLLLFP